MELSENLVKRRNQSIEEDFDDLDSNCLTLTEEILLLGLKEREGFVSFWNDSISLALRGCMLVDLELMGKIVMEPVSFKKKTFKARKVIVKDDGVIGNVILDEALKHIKNADPPENVEKWITYLNGDTWNPIKLKYFIRNVRERLSKLLVEKGVLTMLKKNYLFFDMMLYPLLDEKVKASIVKKIQVSLTSGWSSDISGFKKSDLALCVLASAGDVFENALHSLSESDYDTAQARIELLTSMNFEKEDKRGLHTNSIMWAVFETMFNKL
ncbi:unnamed protein product [Brassicogethes aeneus]|uniref:Golgi phosphoprotein 3 n=1 Tax=Brassicogethes aeneus TaxID=1431903 RepID=A0A9P0BD32_BRAAE|nr:unnamed protein product [Brassicogethes aeneus]